MKKNGLIYAMIKRANYMQNLTTEQKHKLNSQVTALQFMSNEIESINEGIKSNAFHENDSLFSFCNNTIINSDLDIEKTDRYEIRTDSGTFSLSKAALIKELDITQMIISILLKRQESLKKMANMSEEEQLVEIKKLIKEEKAIFSQPGLFTKDKVKALAKGRYLLAAHMTKPCAFDSCSSPNKDLNRFVNLFFHNTKKQQDLKSKDNYVISEYIGIISK